MALNAAASAGNGTFKNGVYNFCVSVRFNATPAQLTQIRTAFQNASQIFADATNGQQRFGTITIVNDSGASQSADYWVFPMAGRAMATLGRYGVRGEHVELYFPSNFQGTSAINGFCPATGPMGADGDAYTIAHEHAHHAFGVVDEYSGPGIANGADCAARPDTATLNFCLMDNYFCRGGRAFGTGYTLNEFCVTSNHDLDGNTFQGPACWNTISSHSKRAATAPVGLPTDAPPASHTVAFNTGFGGLRVMFVIDRSGSMITDQRLDLAKQAAKLFVNFMRTGDSIGLASFECSTSVDFPLTTITGGGTKSAIKSSIDSLVANGSTNIGGGVLAGLGQLTSQPDRSCNEIVVLLTDGDHNCGTDPNSTIAMLQDAGVTVLTVGVGSGISTSGEASLQNLASQTSGKYFRASNSFSLIGVFLQLLLESRVKSNGLLQRAPLAIQSGQVSEIQVPVETGAESAIFGVGIANPADSITVSLRSPSGTIITPGSVGPNVEFNSEPNSKAYQILTPEAGTWTIIISAGTIVNGNLEVFSSAEHDGSHFGVSATKETLAFPEVAEIQAAPTFGGETVIGATVMGNVVRPDGSKVVITLFDDGLAIHGDKIPGDGIYTALFSQYNVSGTYTFELTVTSSGGMTSSGEALFDFAPPNTKPVPAFTRMASATVVVNGVVQGSDVSISKTHTGSFTVGSTGQYVLTVSNAATAAATTGPVTVTDSLPANLTLAGFSGTGWSCSGSGTATATCTHAGPLAAGASLPPLTLTVNVGAGTPTGPNSITNTATVATPGDTNMANNTASDPTTVNPAPRVTITDPFGCTGPGDALTVTAQLTNAAAVAQATTFTAGLPSRLLALPGTCTATAGTCTVVNASTVTWAGTLAPAQTVTITYQAQVADGTPTDTQLCNTSTASFGGSSPATVQLCATVNCTGIGPGLPTNTTSPVGSQKAGSVLIYNIYTSSTDTNRQNTRINITNIEPTRRAYVHLFFVDGASCSVADSYVCLTPNQTTSFLASDLDPGTTGYVVAVAVDANGCPINFNYLIGDEYVKFASGHAANLGAEAITAIAGGLPFCNANSTTAVLPFDGVSYNAIPRVLALDNIGSRGDGNDTLLILNRIGGNLATGAATLTGMFGIFYDDAESAVSFGFSPGTCQFRSSISNSFPRITPRFETFVPPGRTGWARLYSQNDQGILGAAINFNTGVAASSGAFNQGHNLHKLTFTPNMVLTIPIFPPSCQ
jgi:uncharacterized repeat protein (TIGR01451 family)